MKAWQMLDRPIYDLTSKYEPEDRAVTKQEALLKSGLSVQHFTGTIKMALLGAWAVRDLLEEIGLQLWDLKWEFAVDGDDLSRNGHGISTRNAQRVGNGSTADCGQRVILKSARIEKDRLPAGLMGPQKGARKIPIGPPQPQPPHPRSNGLAENGPPGTAGPGVDRRRLTATASDFGHSASPGNTGAGSATGAPCRSTNRSASAACSDTPPSSNAGSTR